MMKETLNWLYYDPSSKTGLRWKKPVYNGGGGLNIPQGSEAGYFDKGSGYFRIELKGKCYSCHRVILYLTLEIEGDFVVDHLDGNRTNNNLENLRIVSYEINCRNRIMSKLNTSGVVGVCPHRARGDGTITHWKAFYYDLDRKLNCKYFSTKEDPDEAFQKACQWRKEKIEFLNRQGAGYSQRHGTTPGLTLQTKRCTIIQQK